MKESAVLSVSLWCCNIVSASLRNYMLGLSKLPNIQSLWSHIVSLPTLLCILLATLIAPKCRCQNRKSGCRPVLSTWWLSRFIWRLSDSPWQLFCQMWLATKNSKIFWCYWRLFQYFKDWHYAPKQSKVVIASRVEPWGAPSDPALSIFTTTQANDAAHW